MLRYSQPGSPRRPAASPAPGAAGALLWSLRAAPGAGEAAGLLALPGCEYRSMPVDGNGPEIGLVGLRAMPPTGLPVEEAAAVVRASGAFAVYNHPNWHFDHWPVKRMLASGAAHALEVYNALIEELPGEADASNKWDRLLSMGVRLWGVAADDAHHARHRDKAWVMVSAPPEAGAIVGALKAGRFYASTGVALEEVRLEDGVLRVRAGDAQRIRFVADRGCVRLAAPGPEAAYAIGEADSYVRVELLGAAGARAWLNPLFVETEASERLRGEFRSWYLAGPMT